MRNTLWAGGLLLLTIVQTLSGLLLLALSAWFIAACALAGPNFNYMLPAVAVRALALMRISTGYGQLWFGHLWLLRRVAWLRQKVFASTENHYLLLPRETVEALNQHTEAVAARWVNWILRQAGSACALLASIIVVWVCTPVAGPVLVPVIITVALLYGLLVRKSLIDSSKTLVAKADFRAQLSEHLRTTPLWHLQSDINPPDASSLWHIEYNQQHRINQALVFVQALCLMLLLFLLWQYRGQLFGKATWMVAPLLLLNLKDWIAPGLLSTPAMLEDLAGVSALDNLPSGPVNPLPPIQSVELSLSRFRPRNLAVCAIDLNTPSTGILMIRGPSGIGKSSLLRAWCGLQPYHGERLANGSRFPPGMPDNWLYLEQLPHCISDTLRVNLTGGTPVAESTLIAALEQVGLGYLHDLDEWLGPNGRFLSGGECKRLEIARALLRDSAVWFVDEPFEGLDNENQNKIAQLFNQLASSTLIIIASHGEPSLLHIASTTELKSSTTTPT